MAKNELASAIAGAPGAPGARLTVADLSADAQQRIKRAQAQAQAANTSRAYAVQLRALGFE